jgi:carnitine-CoA ligase
METFLDARAASYGDAPMLHVDGAGRSYARLLADAHGLARGFASVGIGPGSRIALLLDTSHEAIDVWFAAALLGCVEAPLNTNYRGVLLRHLLDDCAAEFIVCEPHYVAEIQRALEGAAAGPVLVVNGSAAGHTALADLRLDAAGWRPPESDGGQVILYTSGTTGPSKGVVHNQRGCVRLAEYVAEVGGYGPHDRLLNFFPLYHQNARYTGVLTAIAAGASIYLESRFTSSGFWALCRDRDITAFNYLGSVLTMIRSASGEPDPARDTDHGVRVGWGAGATEADRDAFRRRFGVELIEVYGLSEAPMATVNQPGSGCAPGSAGRAGRFFELRVVDDTGARAAAGVHGEIQLRPKIDDVFTRGYFRNEQATVAATQDLWFRTGDRGYVTADGDLFFVERAKDSLRRRGENISAWEVENVLVADPRVREAAVYGIVTPDGEEEVMAALVLADTAADLRDVVRGAARDLPKYAVPRYVRAVADLPRTPTLKVQKAELKRDGVTSDAVDIPAGG